jgi:hypothetical protein
MVIAGVRRVEPVHGSYVPPPVKCPDSPGETGPIPFSKFLQRVNREDRFDRTGADSHPPEAVPPGLLRRPVELLRRDHTLARIGEVPPAPPPAGSPLIDRLLLVERISATGRLIDVVI